MPLQHGAEELVPQAEVQSKPGSQAPIILREDGVGGAVVVDVIQVVDASAARLPRQESCKATAAGALGSRIIGVLCPEVQRSAGCSRLINRELFWPILCAELPGLIADDQRKRVGDRVS